MGGVDVAVHNQKKKKKPRPDYGKRSMESTARRSGGGLLEGFYRVVMRRTSIYATFVIAGAFLGERAVDYGVRRLWEMNNVGKRYEDISVLGQRPSEE